MSVASSLLDQARHWPVRYRKGQVIYDEGDPSSAVFRVRSGCVRLQVNGLEGHRAVVGFLLPGDLFGLCVEERTSAAEAVTDVELSRYSLDSVLQLSVGSQDLVFELIRTVNAQFNGLAHHVESVSHLAARDRVLWFLSWLAHRQDRPGEPVALPMNRRDIADFLALAPETLSRVIRALEAEGAVSFRGPRSFGLRRPALQLAGRGPELDQPEGRTGAAAA